MVRDGPPLSPSVEDYLKAIYSLEEQEQPATTSHIAQILEVQPASVSGMVKRLAEAGFLEHTPYRGVTLTERGRREALRVVRRHRVIEAYLTTRLGYTWDDVHEEAERLEHAASDELVERMAAALKHPGHDPHGAPIPTRGGRVEAPDYYPLSRAEPGDAVVVRMVQDDDPERLRYVESLGLLPGTRLYLAARAPFDGPVTVRLGGAAGEEVVIGFELARRLYVSPAR